MQRCSKCGRTYEEDAQKFCTHDGGRLEPYNPPASASAPTAYDLNQTIRTDPFDPEATVTRMPDLNKTVASMPTSEIRSKETGPATPPPPATPHQAPQQPLPPQSSEPPPTIMYQQPPMPQQGQPPQPPPQQQYYQPAPPQHAAESLQPPHAQQQYTPSGQLAHQHHGAQAAAAAPRKSNRLPLIIGLVVLLLAGGAAAWYFLIYKKGETTANSNSNVASANTNTSENTNANANTSASNNANTTPTEPAPPANATRFVSSAASLDGKLAEYFSNFSFYYPNNWERDPKAGVAGASNFVKLDRQESPEFPQERFVVSFYESKGTFEADRSIFQNLVQTYSDRFEQSYRNYRKVSEGETVVNEYDAYEFRFESKAEDTAKGDITYWGRVIFLPPGIEGDKKGITLLMLTSSLAPELKSADDVGVKGELPVILNSFTLGNNK